MRPAIVIARLVRPVAFAAEAAVALQHQLPGKETQLKRKITCHDRRVIALAIEFEPPVVDPHAGALELGVRERKAGASGALVVHQAAALRVAERRVREENLPGIEAARVIGDLFGTRAKKSDLKAQRSGEPAGDVPPLDAVVGMRAVVARKGELRIGSDDGVIDL